MNKPVTILTGFLGSGKTTYLNHLLQENDKIRYAIIENEYGEQGIDNELVIYPDDTIVELNNGCLCCTLNDNLYEILNELHERRDQFDEVIIEATGVADPSGLAQPFIIHPAIRKDFPHVATICLVDAELIEDQLGSTKEAINQITNSDILLLNKTDLVSNRYIESLEQKLKTYNPMARIVRGNKDDFPQISYKKGNTDYDSRLSKIALEHGSEGGFPVDKPHKPHHNHEHTEEINSHSFVYDEPFDFQMLYQQLFVYLTFQSQDLLRMKGIFWTAHSEKKQVLQSAGKRLVVEEKGVWSPSEARKSVVVFIGKSLQRKGLEQLLNRSLKKGLIEKLK